jgi:hypothetical protein
MAKQTIEQALQDDEIVRSISGLLGCPIGGWNETAQARAELRGQLPQRADRAYSVDELIEASLCADASDRYRWRPEVAAKIDAADAASTASRSEWSPTHAITYLGRTRRYMLRDGVLYTPDEWNDCAAADWEIVGGELLFQGEPARFPHELQKLHASKP